MFGYVRPFKPQMRVCEWEMYNGCYCGMCRKITEEYGAVCSATLSYDIVFLELIAAGLTGVKGGDISAERHFCPAHPLKKKMCVSFSGKAQDYAAAVQVILSYHKLTDDLWDGTVTQKLRALSVLPFMILPYRKAAGKYGKIAAAVSETMKDQRYTERRKVRSIDRAAEPTAAMTAAVFRELGGCDPELRVTLGEMGYMLGRYIYICDAYDDLKNDIRYGQYNPLKTKKDPKAAAQSNIYLTLGRLSEIYSRLELGEIKAVTDNIVYLGLRHTFDNIGKRRSDPGRIRDCAGYR